METTTQGRTIRRLRKAYGWSLRDLSARTEQHGSRVAPSTINRIERGNRPGRLDTLHAIAVGLGVSVPALLVGDARDDAPADGACQAPGTDAEEAR